ncbi:retrotransposon protein, putative, ty1-copia subclass [Tanacetum coccineum]
MLAIAMFHDYEIWQMDVKTTFLNEKLTEDVFMAQLKGFENVNYPKRVCKLQKAIYGLKQASRSWNLCFHEKVTQFGFSRSEDESCIYVKVSRNVVVFLVLYVDDILLIRNDIPTLQSVKYWLWKCFTMKDLVDASYILGIKIYRDRSKRLIGLSQDTYLDKILKRFKMENSKKGNLPLHHSIKIIKDLYPKTNEELNRMSRVPYASVVGSIMYVMTCTRPDVSFALNMVSRLTWKSSKQDIVADFTYEFEYITACEASKEAIWMKNFIGDLGVVPIVQDPIEILCDNESVVALTKEPKDYGKSKDLEVAFEYPGGSPAGIHGLFSGWYYGLASRKVTLRVSMAWAKGVTTGTLCALSLDKLAMPPHLHRKFRIGVAVATGCRGYYKPGIRAWVIRGSRKIRIPVDMYPCRVEERLTIKLVKREEVLKIETTVTAKDVDYDISDSDSDLESTARSGPRDSKMEDTGGSGI